MKCCDNKHDNGNKQENKHKGHMSHMWMMALCCGAPMLLILLIPIIGASMPGLRNTLAAITPFLCPLMMLIMIPMMFRKEKGKEAEANHRETKQIESKQME